MNPITADVSAILNIGAGGTEISILRGDLLVFTRSVPAGGNALTQAITDTLGLAWHDAEGLKREMGDALAPNVLAPDASTPAAANAPDDWTEYSGASSAPASSAAAAPAFPVDHASTPFSDAMTGTATPAAPASSDPFDDEFFNQGPLQSEPGEQQQLKESGDEGDAQILPARDGELASTEAIAGARDAGPVESTVLPSRDEAASETTSTSAAPTSSAAQADAAPAPPRTPPTASAPDAAATQAAQTAAGMPVELRALFNFEEVEDPDEELPTAEDGTPLDINSLLGEEEDDLSDLPTLVSDAPAPAPMPSAFDFPVAATTAGDESDESLPTRSGAASTEAISGSDAIDAAEASLLPTATAASSASAASTTPAASAFSFGDDPFAAVPSSTGSNPPAAPAPAAAASADFGFGAEAAASTPAASVAASAPAATPIPAAGGDDPFAAFDLSGAAPGSAAPASAVETTASSAADDFDLDSLFGGAPSTPAQAATPAAVSGAAPIGAEGLSALDILGTGATGGAAGATDFDVTDFGAGDFGTGDFGAADFGSDFSSFGAGLGGASAGEIDAATLHGIVGPALENLIAEVRRSLEYHTTRYPDAAVRRITLIGGGAKLKNLDAYFTQSLGIPTSVGNPLARLSLQAPKLPPGYADENGPLFAVALGLAMRELMK